MNPIEIMDEIERHRAFAEGQGEIRSLDACDDWQSLRTAIEAQAEELAELRAEREALTSEAHPGAHLAALCAGLKIPNVAWWLQRSPENIKALGETIARQAKGRCPAHVDGIPDKLYLRKEPDGSDWVHDQVPGIEPDETEYVQAEELAQERAERVRIRRRSNVLEEIIDEKEARIKELEAKVNE